MGLVSYTAEAFARAQKTLLPAGPWKLSPDSYVSKVFLAAGDELVRISERARDLLRESVPSQAEELLPEYETDLGLPSTGTVAERQARVKAKETRRPGFRPQDVKNAIAPYLGLDSSDVVVIERTRAQVIAMEDDQEIYRFFVYRDPSLAGAADIEAAHAELEKISHSHTKGHIIESVDFRCDDPRSLCDRDILGA